MWSDRIIPIKDCPAPVAAIHRCLAYDNRCWCFDPGNDIRVGRVGSLGDSNNCIGSNICNIFKAPDGATTGFHHDIAYDFISAGPNWILAHMFSNPDISGRDRLGSFRAVTPENRKGRIIVRHDLADYHRLNVGICINALLRRPALTGVRNGRSHSDRFHLYAIDLFTINAFFDNKIMHRNSFNKLRLAIGPIQFDFKVVAGRIADPCYQWRLVIGVLRRADNHHG